MLLNSEWLQALSGIALDAGYLADRLTMSGLEVDGMDTVAPPFSGVVVAQVVDLVAHPDADKLRVATVDAGTGALLQIVCGAPNVAKGVKVPAALVGAQLPGDFAIKLSKLRGVESQGMLCSAKELGIDEDASGLLILPEDAPVGMDIRQYLRLDDVIIDIDLTPNRADCFSMRGLAREISVICAEKLGDYRYQPAEIAPVAAGNSAVVSIDNRAPQSCPQYFARRIDNVDASRATPSHIVERLERAGVRSHDAIVDITNYVMLELGTPMHAFDADKIRGGIVIRDAQAGETLALLNDSTATLAPDVLVIADHEKALALAGVMGGADSACSLQTRHVILESAWFDPVRIAGKARRFGLASDSAQRFERGVDFTLQRAAMEYATRLILETCGGEASAVFADGHPEYLPTRERITLEHAAIAKRLGREYAAEDVVDMLTRSGCAVEREGSRYHVIAPPWRFDMAIAEDLIEEVARIQGYAQIAAVSPQLQAVKSEAGDVLRRVRKALVATGFQEAITYSFIDRNTQQAFFGEAAVIALQNPISQQLAEMRLGLIPGLVNTALYNRNRQQSELRLFEIGRVFLPDASGDIARARQPLRVAALMHGNAASEQWNHERRALDFYDIKGVLENLFDGQALQFSRSAQPWLHPGQSADVHLDGRNIGVVGAVHPAVAQALGFKGKTLWAFEVEADAFAHPATAQFRNIPKFPSVRRDLALVLDENLSAQEIIDAAKKVLGAWCRDIFCFDLFAGESLGTGKKSLAFGIILQNEEKTLQDEEVEGMISDLLTTLQSQFGAELR
ncbi:MAG: phenylalanine--tRNA ligase subunit beta [Cardiobacteriaceae bacterium]|nr:phenylalanine--tRNA ligase subunit beta [Cardiobacteriaceae bacterium]